MKHRIALALATVGILLMPMAAARAITVSPILFEFDIARGASKQDVIKIWNDSAETQIYSLLVKNFIASGEEGAQEYIEEPTASDLASWVTVDKSTVTLEPGASADFPFVISIPADAEPGGHYAAIFFSNTPSQVKEGVGIGARTGVLLLVNVPGEIREDARVESFRLMGGNILSRLPANFELRIRNLGNTHFRPRGTLVIRNILGSVVARVAANPKNSSVLPESVRRVYTAWVNTQDIPAGGFWTEVKNEWRNFALGRYTATVDVSYGSKDAKLPVQSVSFWVLPWHLLLLAVVGIVVLFLLLKLYNAMIVRAALKRTEKK